MLTHDNIRLGHRLPQVAYNTYKPLSVEQGSGLCFTAIIIAKLRRRG